MRIGIVNDLALARAVLRRVVLSAPGCTVAWEAVDGADAVHKAQQDRPDAILMDLLMPVMNGAEATRRIMAQSPCPILIVTSDVAVNYALVCEAMSAGGLDAVNTPTLAPDGTVKDGQRLVERLAKLEKALARGTLSGIRSLPKPPSRDSSVQPTAAPSAGKLPTLVVLGASTGGPEALAKVLGPLPRDLPARVVVIQHIAADFAPGLVRWLQGHTTLPVQLAKEGDEPRAGQVFVAGTNDHLLLNANVRFAYSPEPADNPYRPSVDVFLNSPGVLVQRSGVAVLLTGMGSDGAHGLLRRRQAGWLTLAQDEASCVVYGMPRIAAQLQAACEVLSPGQMASRIMATVR